MIKFYLFSEHQFGLSDSDVCVRGVGKKSGEVDEESKIVPSLIKNQRQRRYSFRVVARANEAKRAIQLKTLIPVHFIESWGVIPTRVTIACQQLRVL